MRQYKSRRGVDFPRLGTPLLSFTMYIPHFASLDVLLVGFRIVPFHSPLAPAAACFPCFTAPIGRFLWLFHSAIHTCTVIGLAYVPSLGFCMTLHDLH